MFGGSFAEEEREELDLLLDLVASVEVRSVYCTGLIPGA